MKLFKRLQISKSDNPKRRCMVCKYWKPETEATGRCKLGNPPIYKHPNYVCERFEPDC